MPLQMRTAEIAYARSPTYERYAPNQDTGIAMIRRLLTSDCNPKQTPTDVYSAHSIE